MKKGVTRVVFELGRYVIKIPRIDNNHLNFLQGCLANWRERNYCKMFKDLPEFYNKVAPSFFCSWFGLFQIQGRCETRPPEPTLKDLENKLELLSSSNNWDKKVENIGYYKDHWVWLDYGD